MADETDPGESVAEVPAAEETSAQAATFSHDDPIGQLSVGHLSRLIASEVQTALSRQIGGGLAAGSHVNSGPPGFVNGGGHANFDPHAVLQQNIQVGNPAVDAGLARSHVNSGPPGFVNGGGHANFDPGSVFQQNVIRAGNPAINPGMLAGSHVNSGPPGFVNGGGHANFDPRAVLERDEGLILTLNDGRQVSIPAKGPVNLTVRGMRITR